MLWPDLTTGVLLRRIKRFTAEVVLADGRMVRAHCPNTGAMTGCCEPGRRVYLSKSDNPARKLPYTWEMIDMGGSLVGINTGRTSQIVEEGLRKGTIAELSGYGVHQREVTTSPGTRIDFGLFSNSRPDCFVEVKNCTLVDKGVAFFPDAVTARGQKHLRELIRLREQGHRAVIFYLIQRSDASCLYPADHVDPEYGALLRQAIAAGVEALAYDTRIDTREISIRRRLPCPEDSRNRDELFDIPESCA
ncbi:MAG: DNA/RNA nuclease SfsA [Desulfovibrionales bacterium]